MNHPVNHILVIQTAFIGDIVMSTPLFEGLRKIYPDASIDAVVNSRYVSILANNPNIRKIYGFDKSRPKSLHLLRLIRTIRKNRYDLAVSMQRHLSSSLMMLLGGIGTRIGSSKQAMLTRPVAFPPGIHNREKAGLLLQEIHKQAYDLQTRLYPSENDNHVANTMISGNNRFRLGVAPGSVWETKKWPKQSFIETISSLSDQADIYLIGGGQTDIELCREIAGQLPDKNIINVSGKLTLLQSAALIRELDLVLCNDSAPLHMANAMNTPVFAFFGPTVKRFGCYPYQPLDKMIETDLYCRPCTKHGGKVCPEGHFRCMKEITPGRVVTMIRQFMKDPQHDTIRITD
jgi:heptosyltransferase II